MQKTFIAESVIDDGKAVSNALVRAGCSKIALADKDEDNLKTVEESCRILGNHDLDILIVRCDVLVPEDVDALITATIRRFGSINYCANCLRPAIIRRHATALETDEFLLPNIREVTSAWQRGVSRCIKSAII